VPESLELSECRLLATKLRQIKNNALKAWFWMDSVEPDISEQRPLAAQCYLERKVRWKASMDSRAALCVLLWSMLHGQLMESGMLQNCGRR
jgi:hypothetical protein